MFETAKPVTTARQDGNAVEAILAGNKPPLYKRPVYDRLLKTAMRYVQNAADAEDAVIEGLMTSYRNRERFSGKTSLNSWLTQTVIWRCSDVRRKRIAYDENVELVQDQESRTDSPSFAEDLCRLIERNMDTLTPEQREVLMLRTTGMKYTDIASRAGIPKGTVMSRLNRARQVLARSLREDPAIGEYPLLMKAVMDKRYDR